MVWGDSFCVRPTCALLSRVQLEGASGVVRPAPDPLISVDPPTAATQSPGLRPTPLSIAGVAGEVSHQKVASFFPVASHCWLGAAGLPWMLPSRERDVQWAGQGPFRLVLQALFVAVYDDDPRNDEEHGQHEEHDAERPTRTSFLMWWGMAGTLCARHPLFN